MDEKIFSLLETMYSDLTKKIDNIGKELKDLKDNSATKHDLVKFEDKMYQNHKALYDGYKLTYEKLELLEGKIIY